MSVFKEGIYTYRFYENCFWLLLFHHNTTEGGFFSDKESAKFSLDESKFSILSHLHIIPKINQIDEFLLEYPGLSHRYNWWRQSLNPLSEIEVNGDGSQNSSGFEPISLNWTVSNFGGLMVSISGCTLLDG